MPDRLAQYLEPRGRVADLARRLGVTHAAIRQWNLKRIPPLRILQVERYTGIPRHVLRPDLYAAPRVKRKRGR